MYRTILNIEYEPIMFRKLIDNEEDLPYKVISHHTDLINEKFYVELLFKKISREQKDLIENEQNLSAIYKVLQQLK